MQDEKRPDMIRILLVEDDEKDRLLFRRIFDRSKHPYEITECVHAEKALEVLHADNPPYHVAVVDHGLPGMSGMDLCRKVLEEEIPIPMVLLTGMGTERLAVEALKRGIYDYFAKDADLKYLNSLASALPGIVCGFTERQARKRTEEALRKARDELEKRVEERTQELTDTNALLEMEINERQRTEEALRTSEESLREILENVLTAIVIVDPSTRRILDINNIAAEIIGAPRDKVIGHEFDRFIYPADNEENPVKDLGQKINNSENLILTADGRAIPVLKTVTSLKLGGRDCLVKSFVDIRKHKEYEARLQRSLKEKEMLLREIHHRVKNNLLAVSCLLNSQAAYVQDEFSKKAFLDSQNRILSMAIIHEKLYQLDDFSRIDFETYVKTLMEHLFKSYAASPGHLSVEIRMADIKLNVDTAIPCGLIITELATNSLKHAFPNGEEGMIRIQMTELNPGMFALTVSDDGVGIPDSEDLENSGSLGMILVRSMIQQLSGTISLNREDGTTFAFEFPEYFEAGSELC